MGAEQSHEADLGDDVVPETLSERSIEAVAQYIKDSATNIVVLTGAGISTSAGIPDFRSPETGLYANLERLGLPYAEAVFDISYFRNNPEPFYILARELYPGKFIPTISHAFIFLLSQKDKLCMLFTQNIDCLERAANIPSDMIIEAHGSFATQSCIECDAEYPKDLMLAAIENSKVPYCSENTDPEKPNAECNGLVKPDIVFFGEQLPAEFHNNLHIPRFADLMLIIGTSLTVHPFASLPGFAPEGVPRVLFNKEKVGGLGSRPDDVCVLGSCDEGIRKLADALGWTAELEELWAGMGGGKDASSSKDSNDLEDKLDQITTGVEKTTLNSEPLSQKHVKEKQQSGPGSPPSETASKLEPTPKGNVEDEKELRQEHADTASSAPTSETAPKLEHEPKRDIEDEKELREENADTASSAPPETVPELETTPTDDVEDEKELLQEHADTASSDSTSKPHSNINDTSHAEDSKKVEDSSTSKVEDDPPSSQLKSNI